MSYGGGAWERSMVYTLCVSACVSVCKKRKSFSFFFFQLVGVPTLFAGLLCVVDGCGLRLAIRAKSSTNPAGRGLGLRFQRGDLQEKQEDKLYDNIRTWNRQEFNVKCRPVLNDKVELQIFRFYFNVWSWSAEESFFQFWWSNSYKVDQVHMYTDLQHRRTLTGTRRAWVHPGRPWARAPRPRRWACRCDGRILPARRTSPPLCCWWVLSVWPKRREKKMARKSVIKALVSKLEINTWSQKYVQLM